MREKSITQAAARLSMTQPAVSNAVSRMRVLWKEVQFKDNAYDSRLDDKQIGVNAQSEFHSQRHETRQFLGWKGQEIRYGLYD